jgi:hypothetical protein
VSAIGNQAPLWIAVAPDYWNTRMVAALSTAMDGCSRNCNHLWVTRDGGATWRDHPLGFDAAHLLVLNTRSGIQSIVTESSAGVRRSDDDGTTWTVLGPPGVPVADQSDAVIVAVPDGHDYVVDGSGRHDVQGSGSSRTDLTFARAEFSGWLAAVDRGTGTDVVMRCDTGLHCSGGAALPGEHSADITLLVANRERDVVVRTATGLYRSGDGGRTYAPLTLPVTPGNAYTTVAAAVIEPGVDTEVVYVALLRLLHAGTGAAASTDGGVYVTVNGGVSWRAVGRGSLLDGGSTAVAAAPDGRLFAGYVNADGRAGLMCHDDDNGGWRGTCPRWKASCQPQCTAGGPQGDAGPDGAANPAVDGTSAATSGAGGAIAGAANPRGGKPAASSADGGDGPSPVSIAALVLGLAVAVLATPLSRLRRPRR